MKWVPMPREDHEGAFLGDPSLPGSDLRMRALLRDPVALRFHLYVTSDQRGHLDAQPHVDS